MVCFPQIPAPKELSMFTCVVSAVIAAVTIVGNASIVITVIRDPLKKLHNPFNYFLVNLAVSDLIIGVLTMPVSAYAHYTEYAGNLKTVVVQTLHMSYFISASASLLSLITLSLDRLFAITQPHTYKSYSRFHHCVLVSIVIWITSLSIPFVYFEWDYIGYLMFFAHSAIIVGLIILVIVHVSVKKYLEVQKQKMTAHVTDSAPQESVERYESREMEFQKKITRAFVLMLCAFVCVYIPAVIMIYILHFCETCHCTLRHVLRDLQFLLISSNSCMNPFIYGLRVKVFRQSLKAMFGRNHEVTASANTAQTGSVMTIESVSTPAEIN